MNLSVVTDDLRILQLECNAPVAPSLELARDLGSLVTGLSDQDAETVRAAVSFLRGDMAALKELAR